MTEFKPHICASVGMKTSLLFVTLGAVTAFILMLTIFGVNGTYDILIDEGLQIQLGVITGIAALFLSAVFLGRIAGRIICHKLRSFTGAIFVGICLAISCIVIAIIAGALFAFLVQELSNITPEHKSDLLVFILAPLFWILFFGVLPAMLFGGLYGILVRRRLAKVV